MHNGIKHRITSATERERWIERERKRNNTQHNKTALDGAKNDRSSTYTRVKWIALTQQNINKNRKKIKERNGETREKTANKPTKTTLHWCYGKDVKAINAFVDEITPDERGYSKSPCINHIQALARTHTHTLTQHTVLDQLQVLVVGDSEHRAKRSHRVWICCLNMRMCIPCTC